MTAWRNQYEWYNPGGIFGSGIGLREQRGGIVQTDKGPRVEIRRPDGTTTLGHLSGSLDADLNPGAVLADHQNSKRDAKEAELREQYERRRQDDLDRQDRALRGQETRDSNTLQVALAGLTQQLEADRNRTGLLQAQITQQGQQAQNTHELATEQLRLNNITQNRQLDLKGMEMQANIALQQGDLALRKEQLADLRGSRKLAFIGQAVSSLLA